MIVNASPGSNRFTGTGRNFVQGPVLRVMALGRWALIVVHSRLKDVDRFLLFFIKQHQATIISGLLL